MNDDFNTPILISHLFDGVKIVNSCINGDVKLTKKDISKLSSILNNFAIEILGFLPVVDSHNNLTKELINLITEFRNESKKNEDFKTSDYLRDELLKLGVEIKDSKNTTEWEIKN